MRTHRLEFDPPLTLSEYERFDLEFSQLRDEMTPSFVCTDYCDVSSDVSLESVRSVIGSLLQKHSLSRITV
jgi:hypothetical protein